MIYWEDLLQYGIVFGMLVIAAFGAPIPEEIPIITAGVKVGIASQNPDSTLVWWIMLPVCILGIVICDGMLYTIGRVWGRQLMRNGWVQRNVLPEEKRKRIEENFHEYGVGILMFARLLPGIRTPIFLMSGIMKLPFYRFLLADGIYAIPGVNLLFWLGYVFGDQFKEAFGRVQEHRSVIVAVVFAAIGGFVIYHVLFRRMVSTGDPSKLPEMVKKVVTFGTHSAGNHPVAEIPRVLEIEGDTLPKPNEMIPPPSKPPKDGETPTDKSDAPDL